MRPLIVVVVLFAGVPAAAQQLDIRLKPDSTLMLGELHRAAEASDPRTRELNLLQQQWALRDRNVAVQRLPHLTLDSQAQYQSDVPASPFVSLDVPSAQLLCRGGASR